MNTANYTISEVDFVEAQMLFLYSKNPMMRTVKYLAVVFIIVIVIGINGLFAEDKVSLQTVAILLGMLMFVVFVFTHKYRLKKLYRKIPAMSDELTIKCGDEEYEVSGMHGSSVCKYNEILNLYENGKIMVIQNTPISIHILPKTTNEMINISGLIRTKFA